MIPQIAKITLNGDRVEELIVVDELYDAVAEAMDDAPLPNDFPDQEGIPKEQVEADFKEFCKSIAVRSCSLEQLVTPNPDAIPPEVQFIRPVTMGMKIQGYIEHWDAAIGFSESLKQTGCPISFSFNEKKMLFGIAHLLNVLAANQARQVQAANNGVQMFDPNI